MTANASSRPARAASRPRSPPSSRRSARPTLAPTDGGVAFAGALALAYRANLESRLASRILWRVGGGALPRRARALRARARRSTGRSISRRPHAARRRRRDALAAAQPRVRDADASRTRCATAFRERHGHAAVGRQARARRARLRAPHRARGDDLPRHVRRAAVQARLPARHRGGAAAREPRGRACSRWPAGRPGRRSSTRCAAAARSPIEAALIAADRAPGLARTLRLPEARVVRRPGVAAHQAGGARPRRAPRRDRRRMFASDIAPAAVAQDARATCAPRSVDGFVARRARRRARRARRPRRPACIVTNPPYGVRLADQDELAALYPQLGDALKQRFAGWTRVLPHRRPAPRRS